MIPACHAIVARKLTSLVFVAQEWDGDATPTSNRSADVTSTRYLFHFFSLFFSSISSPAVAVGNQPSTSGTPTSARLGVPGSTRLRPASRRFESIHGSAFLLRFARAKYTSVLQRSMQHVIRRAEPVPVGV